MKQLPEYVEKDTKGKVYHLWKMLYGLKQLEHHWYQKLVDILIYYFGFIHYYVDKAIFYWFINEDFVVILVHVNNCTIGSNSIEYIVHSKNLIRKHVEITDINKLHWPLGLEITRNCKLHTISISQYSYIDFILYHHNFDRLKPISIPIDTSLKLSSAQCSSTTAKIAKIHNILYCKCVEGLIYIIIGTCSDIFYAVQTVLYFMHNPGLEHW